jgi:hypothetical protein
LGQGGDGKIKVSHGVKHSDTAEQPH